MTDSDQKIMNALREIYKQNVELKHFMEQALGTTVAPTPKAKAAEKPWEKWKPKDSEQDTNKIDKPKF